MANIQFVGGPCDGAERDLHDGERWFRMLPPQELPSAIGGPIPPARDTCKDPTVIYTRRMLSFSDEEPIEVMAPERMTDREMILHLLTRLGTVKKRLEKEDNG